MGTSWGRLPGGTDGGGQVGGVTAEFAAAMPAVILVIAGCLGALSVLGDHVRLVDAAADAARALSRGEEEQRVEGIVGQLVPGASLVVTHRGEFVCARLATTRLNPPALGIRIDASSCALAGGL